MTGLRPVSFRYFPAEWSTSPLGLVCCQDPAGRRVTEVIDGEHLRALERAERAHPGMLSKARLDPKRGSALVIEGWPQDWAPEGDETRRLSRLWDAAVEYGWERARRSASDP